VPIFECGEKGIKYCKEPQVGILDAVAPGCQKSLGESKARLATPKH
jgi:hypothetical protein